MDVHVAGVERRVLVLVPPVVLEPRRGLGDEHEIPRVGMGDAPLLFTTLAEHVLDAIQFREGLTGVVDRALVGVDVRDLVVDHRERVRSLQVDFLAALAVVFHLQQARLAERAVRIDRGVDVVEAVLARDVDRGLVPAVVAAERVEEPSHEVVDHPDGVRQFVAARAVGEAGVVEVRDVDPEQVGVVAFDRLASGVQDPLGGGLVRARSPVGVKGEVAVLGFEFVVEAVGVRPAVHLEDVVVLVLDRRRRERHVGTRPDEMLEAEHARGEPGFARRLPKSVPGLAVAFPERHRVGLSVVLAVRDVAVIFR